MEWTISAASTLRPRRITVAIVSVAATASIGYLLYRTVYDPPLPEPQPGHGLHRSNAVRRRRRSLFRNRAPSDSSSTSAESRTDENAPPGVPLADGETVAEDPDTDGNDWWNPENAPRAGQNIVTLLFRVSEDNARRNAYVHRGCACNGCGIVPIRGIRYRCANCADFDLCEACESSGLHINTHIFYKVKIPAPPFGPRQLQPVWYTGDPENCIRKLPRNIMIKLSRETGFERPELEASWEQWTFIANTEWRDDPDELYLAMDRRTFERCLVPSGGYRHTSPNLIHDRMFAFYDTNNDDLIGFSEFLHGLSYKKRKDKLKRIFQGYDMDGDGFVSRKDFLRIFRAYYVLYKQMHQDILEGLDDQVLASSEVHQLVTGRQPLSGLFGREGRVPPARGSRRLEGKVPRDGEMVVDDNLDRVVSDDKPDTADRNAILTSLFHPRNPDSRYGRHGRANYAALEEGRTSPHRYSSASSQSDDGAMHSGRYWSALLNPPVGIEELPPLLSGEVREGDDLFVSDEPADMYGNRGSWADEQANSDAENQDIHPNSIRHGRQSSDRNLDVPLLPLDLANGYVNGHRLESHGSLRRSLPGGRLTEAGQRALAEHSHRVAKAKRERAQAREALLQRWRRRQFYLDEEEGVAAPDGWDLYADEADDLGHKDPNWETPKSGQHQGPSRSRASSKVRFAEDTDDYEIRSNPSTSSRSVPERWGGMEIPDAERDAGKEILYQVTQQAYNELLDILFKSKEDDAILAAGTRAQREHYKDLIERTNWEDVKEPWNEQDGSENETLEDIRRKSLDELLARAGYSVDPALEKQGEEANGAVLAETDSMYETWEHVGDSAQEPLPTQSTAEDEQRDPTMPQFRPNSTSDAPLPTRQPSVSEARSRTPLPTSPRQRNGISQTPKGKGKAPASGEEAGSKKAKADEDTAKLKPWELIDRRSLHLWKSCQMAEEEARKRGGWGRLSFEEFEKIFKDEERRDNRLDYLGSWIDFCIP